MPSAILLATDARAAKLVGKAVPLIPGKSAARTIDLKNQIHSCLPYFEVFVGAAHFCFLTDSLSETTTSPR